MDIDHEVGLLAGCIKKIGKAQPDGSVTTTFGEVIRFLEHVAIKK